MAARRAAHRPSSSLDYQPELAALAKVPPDGDDWLHEVKFDGYRIGCRLERKQVSLISRNGKDWTSSFPEIVDAAERLRARRALIDGEIAIVLPDGRTSFQALQNAFGGGSRKGLVYLVFDLLRLDDEDLTNRPLEERKSLLRSLVEPENLSDRIRYSDHVVGRGPEFFREACRHGLEGIVSKRLGTTYRPGRSDAWLKTKCVLRQEFVLGGFTDPEGSRVGIGALLVGYYDRDRLTFAGKVGTGLTHKTADDLRTRLERLAERECPFDPPPPGLLGRSAHWARPELVGEVEFSEWTADGKIRHPSFKGLRSDKSPREVTRERPEAPPAAADGAGDQRDPVVEPILRRPARRVPRAPKRQESENDVSKDRGERTAGLVAGVRISHPHRVLFPKAKLTKLNLARYYEAIGPWMLPHVAGRPLTLVHCPAGVTSGLRADCHFMKHSTLWAPAALKRVKIREKKKVGDYLVATSVESLVALAQMDILEIHTWNSTVDHLEKPDRLVFDIDPGPLVAWRSVVSAARHVRKVLETLGLRSFVKTTGGHGLHVVVPLVPKRSWNECLAFARGVAELIEQNDPEMYTTSFRKAGRERLMLIDYLRNNRTNTSVAAFSTRARPDATVSVPLSWEELGGRTTSDRYTVTSLPARLARIREDPWRDYWSHRQTISQKSFESATQGSSRL